MYLFVYLSTRACEQVRKEDLMKTLLKKLTPYFAIVGPSGEPSTLTENNIPSNETLERLSLSALHPLKLFPRQH